MSTLVSFCRDVCLWALVVDIVWLAFLLYHWPRTGNGYRTHSLIVCFALSIGAILVALYAYPRVADPQVWAAAQLEGASAEVKAQAVSEGRAQGALYCFMRTLLMFGLVLAANEAAGNRVRKETYWKIALALLVQTGLFEVTRALWAGDPRPAAVKFHEWMAEAYVFALLLCLLPYVIPLVRQEQLLVARPHDPICLMVLGIGLSRLGPELWLWARTESLGFELSEIVVKAWALSLYRGPPAKTRTLAAPGPRPVKSEQTVAVG